MANSSQETLFHPSSFVESDDIGPLTRIWQFTIVLPGASIGGNCKIGSHCFIESDVIIGDRVTVKNGVSIWNGLRIGDGVFVGPHVVFTNDKYPRSRPDFDRPLRTVIEDGVSIGAGATILPGLTLGKNCVVGAGAVVTKSIPPNTTVIGNPARDIATNLM